MADLSAIPKENIEALETALASIGFDVGAIDGVADADLRVSILAGLQNLNRLFGDENNNPITGYDGQQVAAIGKAIEEFVQGDGNGLSQFGKLKALVNRDYAALGFAGEQYKDLRETVDSFFVDRTPAEALPDLLKLVGNIPTYGHVRDFLEKMPANIISDIPAAMEFIENSQTYLGVIDAMNTANFFIEEDSPDVVAAADPDVQQALMLVDVKKAITQNPDPDATWGAAEQAALKAKIAEMQAGDVTWLGRKDGVYTAEYADYVLGGFAHLPANERKDYSEADQALFRNLKTLDTQRLALLAEADVPTERADIVLGVRTIDALLPKLVPFAQGQLDDTRADAERLIDSIQGKGLSGEVIEAATAVMVRTDKPEEELSEQERADRKEAQEYLSRTGIADNIGEFIDGFLLLGKSDAGSRLVEKGKVLGVDMIRYRGASLHDLPDVDTLNPNDNRLDMNEQQALQGVLFLTGEKLGIAEERRWPITAEVSKLYVQAINAMPLAEREALFAETLDEDQAAAFSALEQADKEIMIKKGVTDLFAILTMLTEEGVLDKGKLYSREGFKIGDVTVEIFDEFIKGNDDDPENAIAPATPEQLKMLNVMVYAFTEGVDLVDIMGEGYDFPEGFDPIDPADQETLAQLFEGAYSGLDNNETMLMMLDTLPYGTQERRDEMKVVVNKAFEAAEEGRKSGASDEMIAILFASAMESGINAMNDNAQMGSHYRMMQDRLVTIDPRAAKFTMNVGDEVVDATAIKKQHDDLNAGEGIYEPFLFKDGETTYIAAIDTESQVFRIEEVEFDEWRRIVAENPRKPGEDREAYLDALDEKLSEGVNGYDVFFQNSGEVILIHGIGITGFPDVMEGKIKSFEDERADIQSDVEARALEARKEAIEAGTPETPKDVFNNGAQQTGERIEPTPEEGFGAAIREMFPQQRTPPDQFDRFVPTPGLGTTD